MLTGLQSKESETSEPDKFSRALNLEGNVVTFSAKVRIESPLTRIALRT